MSSSYGKNTYKGVYKVKNISKYIGSKNPYYRSNWERLFCVYCDNNVNILRWASELVKIPYKWADGSVHTYITDFYIEQLNNDGLTERLIIEIKPKTFSTEESLKLPKNKTVKKMKLYEEHRQMIEKNHLKWKAAIDYCSKKNIIFKVLTDECFSL